MNELPPQALLTEEEITSIPAALRDQALALAVAAEEVAGVSVAIIFHVAGWESRRGVPALFAGDLPTLTGHLLGTAVGLATASGLFDAGGGHCPACIARRAQPVKVRA